MIILSEIDSSKKILELIGFYPKSMNVMFARDTNIPSSSMIEAIERKTKV